MTKEFYQILEIPETATQEEIKKAYRKLALKWHPDKNPNNQEEAKKKFQEVNKAYGVLSNEEFKKRYDNGEANFTAGFDNEYAKSYWEAKEEKLAEEINIMEDLLKAHKARQEASERIWLLNAEYLERFDTWLDIRNAFDASWPVVIDEYLDSKYNSLWEPYQDWREMVWEIPLNLKMKEKEHSEELKALKEGMIKAIKETEARLQKEKEDEEKRKEKRAASRIEEEKTCAIEEIEEAMTRKGLKAEDLGKYSNYQEQINNLNKKWEIRSLADEIIDYIRNEIINKKLNVESEAWRKRSNDLWDDLMSTSKSSKEKDLEEEIQQLKSQNSGTHTPEQQAETQKKIARKEEEFRRTKEGNNKNTQCQKTGDNDAWNQEKAALEELIKRLKAENKTEELTKKVNQLEEVIKNLEAENAKLKKGIEELKQEKDDSPEYKDYLNKKEAELEDKKQKLEQLRNIVKSIGFKTSTISNNNNGGFPIGWVVGSGILVVVGLTIMLIIRKRIKKK